MSSRVALFCFWERSFTARSSKTASDEGPKTDSVFNRLDVEFGNVDPRTGQQTATAKFRVNNKVVLVGDVGVGGDFRGLVKYLIRFR